MRNGAVDLKGETRQLGHVLLFFVHESMHFGQKSFSQSFALHITACCRAIPVQILHVVASEFLLISLDVSSSSLMFAVAVLI